MADDVVISAEGLGKKYVIGHEAERERYVTLRDVIARAARGALAPDDRHGARPRHRRGRHHGGILGAEGCELRGQARRGARHHRPQWRRQIDATENSLPHHRAERRTRDDQGPRGEPARSRHRLSSRAHRPREHLSQRRHPRHDARRDQAQIRRNRRLSPRSRSSSTRR